MILLFAPIVPPQGTPIPGPIILGADLPPMVIFGIIMVVIICLIFVSLPFVIYGPKKKKE